MAISVRTRFEIFKRDDFQCRYCGRRSPTVVLQIDHVVPVSDSGTDDVMNLVTSCWECNSGKSDISLRRVVTGEDPVDRAVEILERERQLREYNHVMALAREREEADYHDVKDYWLDLIGHTYLNGYEASWLKGALSFHAAEEIKAAMRIAVAKGKDDTRYVSGILRNWANKGKE